MRDFLRGFRVLHVVGPCVTVFGSARIKIDNPHYEVARKMGAAIAQLGFTVMTGGGPGIMEAANRGAKEIYATDSVEEAIAHIRSKAIKPFGLRTARRIQRHLPWLGERGLSPHAP
jgi:predicted Rossmann-fold nucleotide-binding protein